MRNSRRGLGWSPLCALTLACGYGPHNDYLTSDGCPVGSEGCPCAGNDGCEGELACVDGSCQPGDDGESTTISSGTANASSTSSGDSTGATTTDACEFICELDAPQGPQLCDVFAQDCPEGQKCASYDMDGDGAWDSAKCVDVIGDGQPGEPCMAEGGANGVDDCAEGVMYWYLDDAHQGECVALCNGTPEHPSCAPPGTTCWIPSDGSLDLCLPGCDPLTQKPCFDFEVCIDDPNGDGFVCAFDASGDMAPEGTPCEFANVCNVGNMCVNPDFYPNPACQGSIGCCAPFCDLGDLDACAGLSVAEAVCVPYHEPGTAPPGLENVGVCGVES